MKLPNTRISNIFLAVGVVLACALPALMRTLYMVENDLVPIKRDGWGFAGDFANGTAVALLLAVTARWSRAAALAGIVLWVALVFGWYEFLREFGAHLFLVHAIYVTDLTFLKGSAAGIRHPLLAALAVALLAVAVLWLERRRSDTRRLLLVALAGGLMVLPSTFPHEQFDPLWRQQSFLLPNMKDIAIRTMRRMDAVAATDPELETIYNADLSGTPRFEFPMEKRNVLLVMLEGVSGGSFPSFAGHHGVSSVVRFEGLDRLARENLGYSTFFSHQRQTNRGEYSILCGDFPKLATELAKMTEVANGLPKRCLPSVLRSHGYETLYIQSANLTFMFKDRFMPKIGFEVSHGEDWFDPKYPWGGWGVDDRALYQSALPEIEKLDRTGKPWFVTLLTSGTHHPFHFPEDWNGFPDASRETRAMQFADVAVTQLIEDLRAKGLLDDTLVLITSDEASFVHETGPAKEDQLANLTQNWGFLVAITPEGARGRVDDAFQQADVTVSVLDYLGLGAETRPFLGRSVFRDYAEPRKIHFGNVYLRTAAEYLEDRELRVCDESLVTCHLFDMSGGREFSPQVKRTGTAGPSTLLRAVQARSLRSATSDPGEALH